MIRYLYPQLWNGCVGAWAPGLGATGYTLRDRSGYNNHGTLNNMDAGTDWVSSPGGGGGVSLDLDGTNDFVLFPNAPVLQIISTITISFWANIRNNGAVSTLVSKSSIGTDGEFEVFADFRSGANTLSWRPGIASNLAGFFSGFTGIWTHYAFTCNGSGSGSTVTCHRNGRSAGTITTNAARAASVNLLGVGARSGGANFASMQLDDLRVYNREIKPSEVQLLASRRGISYETIPALNYRVAASTGNRRRRLICGANC